jgi:hypothetical protein
MALRINTAQRNRLADDGLLFDGGQALVYTGTQPASANTAASGSLLGTITLPTPALGAASVGVRSKSGTWQATASGSGTAGYVRLVSSSGDRRMDLAVGAEVTFDDAAIISGGTITVTAVAITMPSGE